MTRLFETEAYGPVPWRTFHTLRICGVTAAEYEALKELFGTYDEMLVEFVRDHSTDYKYTPPVPFPTPPGEHEYKEAQRQREARD